MDQKLTAGVAEGNLRAQPQLRHPHRVVPWLVFSQVKEAIQNGQMRRQRAVLWRLKWLRFGEAAGDTTANKALE